MEIVVFTNGCFDLIHPGHVALLKKARALGTKLIVGINSDESVRAIKGKERPFLGQAARASILKEFRSVDEVRVFDENTPERLIREIKPDILVKGGDWATDQIVGADFVLKNGGRVFSIPFEDDYSSSKIADKIKLSEKATAAEIWELKTDRPQDSVENSLRNHIGVFEKLLSLEIPNINRCAEMIFETFSEGKKVLICGNGGSAADSQHLAAEFVGRFETERRALPALALTTDTSALTALANDYNFEKIFSRQVEAFAQKGDLLIAISTSGNSQNVLSAVMKAREMGCRTIGMTGAGGKKLASLCDANIFAPSERTARIQEAHIAICHIWCELIDEKLKIQES